MCFSRLKISGRFQTSLQDDEAVFCEPWAVSWISCPWQPLAYSLEERVIAIKKAQESHSLKVFLNMRSDL
jgi:hypothetical protein